MDFGKEYIKEFENNIEYSEFIISQDYIEPNVSHIEVGNAIHYNKLEHDYSKNYLTFQPLEYGNFTFTIGSAITTTMLQSVSYSVDGGETWTTTNNVDDETVTITTPYVDVDDIVMWKGEGMQCADENWGGNTDEQFAAQLSRFGSSGKFNVYGNIMSLLNGDDFIENDEFESESSANFVFLFGRYNIYDQVKLVSAKNLVLNHTNSKSYQYLFGCSNTLIEIPKQLPSILADRCYTGMFLGCKALKSVPKDYLPSTELGKRCYQNMFSGCTSLMTVPDLPATTLTEYCYDNMFRLCKSLTSVPKDYLPAMTMTTYCYRSMFFDCNNLKNAPDLPATTLADHCYFYMFDGCTSLTEAPELPATTLATYCYANMFVNCTSLTAITCLATDISATGCLNNWTNGVAPTGLFIKDDNMSGWSVGVNGIPSGWTVMGLTEYYSRKYLTFKALEDGTFSFSGNSIDYSLDDGVTWTTLASEANTPTVEAGKTIMWRGQLTPDSENNNGIGTFSSSGNFDAYGNVMSLMYGNSFYGETDLSGKDYAFKGLFDGCIGLNMANYLQLPATTLAYYCYVYMFANCASLVNMPKLPATITVGGDYQYMFANCTSLTKAEDIPATTLGMTTCAYMFQNCTALKAAPKLSATTLDMYCCQNMFQGCTALETVPQDMLPATTLSNWCYNGMFQNCSSLTNTPTLPAPTLTQRCYYNMFSGCSKLNNVTCLATNISATWCTNNWMYGVSSSGTFTKAASMSSWTRGANGIPSNWTVVDAS